jgi:hypothetical protein
MAEARDRLPGRVVEEEHIEMNWVALESRSAPAGRLRR